MSDSLTSQPVLPRRLPILLWELLVFSALLLLGGALRFHIATTWVFAGSDSYGYISLADELYQHGRLALGPDEPLAWWRPPLYALFIALCKGGIPALSAEPMGVGWHRILKGQALVELLLMGPLLWAMARRIGGRMSAQLALALGMLFPITLVFVGAALTESLAMSLTVITIAPLVLLSHRPRLALGLYGIGVGLSLLLRSDGVLLSLAAIPLALSQSTHRDRLIAGGTAFLAFVLTVAPWGLRNQVHFGNPYLFGSHLDRTSRPVPHHKGYWNWLCSWAADWRPLTFGQACFYDLRCSWSPAIVERYDAFTSFDDRDEVERLSDLRRQEGISPAVSAGFAKLARQRALREPFRVSVVLPLSRMAHMWIDYHSEILQNPDWLPIPTVTRQLMPLFPTLVGFLLMFACTGFLALVRRPSHRVWGWTLVIPVVARSLILPYLGYAMPRYAVEAMVLCFILATAGNAQWRRSPVR